MVRQQNMAELSVGSAGDEDGERFAINMAEAGAAHPLSMEITSSLNCMFSATKSSSMFTSPNSFSMTATFMPAPYRYVCNARHRRWLLSDVYHRKCTNRPPTTDDDEASRCQNTPYTALIVVFHYIMHQLSLGRVTAYRAAR